MADDHRVPLGSVATWRGMPVVAAESGEARASRLRALSAERQAEADKYAALAVAVEKGNHGERVVGELLDVLDGAGWCVLHDRYKPGSQANLDHVVVGPSGLYVIDAKCWKPAPLRFDERGMSLRGYRKDEELRAVADCARLVLQRAASAHLGLKAVGVLAFVNDMGLQPPVEHHGVWALQSEDLLRWLTSQPPVLDGATVQRVGATLDAALPPRIGRAKPFTLSDMSAQATAPRHLARSPRATAPAWQARQQPRPSRRRASPRRESFPELVVKLVALLVFVLVIVPGVFGRIPERMAEVSPAQQPSAPATAVPAASE